MSSVLLRTIILLTISNTFMTFAWYAHLRNLSDRKWWIAALASWGIALLEYLFQVPANRIGYTQFSLGQLKILQEVLTLAVFMVFAVLALMFEYPSWRWPNELEWLGTAYSGVVTFAISYLAWFKVARKLSPVASGLSIMLVPILGLTSGWLILGEQIAWSDIAALVLILAAMALVLWPTSKPKIQAQA